MTPATGWSQELIDKAELACDKQFAASTILIQINQLDSVRPITCTQVRDNLALYCAGPQHQANLRTLIDQGLDLIRNNLIERGDLSTQWTNLMVEIDDLRTQAQAMIDAERADMISNGIVPPPPPPLPPNCNTDSSPFALTSCSGYPVHRVHKLTTLGGSADPAPCLATWTDLVYGTNPSRWAGLIGGCTIQGYAVLWCQDGVWKFKISRVNFNDGDEVEPQVEQNNPLKLLIPGYSVAHLGVTGGPATGGQQDFRIEAVV